MRIRTITLLLVFNELVELASSGAPVGTHLGGAAQTALSASSPGEPSPWLMLLGGLGLLGMVMRFRRHRTD
jgi:MYXO-CTERM domain-containing protein